MSQLTPTRIISGPTAWKEWSNSKHHVVNDHLGSHAFELSRRPESRHLLGLRRRMLTDHCSALGNKTIESVRVLNSRETTSPPTMYFVLTDVATTTPAKSSKRSAAGQRRDAKRQSKSDPGGSECSQLLGSA